MTARVVPYSLKMIRDERASRGLKSQDREIRHLRRVNQQLGKEIKQLREEKQNQESFKNPAVGEKEWELKEEEEEVLDFEEAKEEEELELEAEAELEEAKEEELELEAEAAAAVVEVQALVIEVIEVSDDEEEWSLEGAGSEEEEEWALERAGSEEEE